MNKRYEQLDSLRGIAAITVLLYHYVAILNDFWENTSPTITTIKHTPLSIVWAGYEAVLFFFVLSGFVLSLQFYSNKKLSYRNFLIGRFFRIYIPCYVAVLIGIFCKIYFYRPGVEGFSFLFTSVWDSPLTLGTFFYHAVLLFYFGYGEIVLVLWTLVMEMRISLIFPLLMLLIKKYNWKCNLLIGIGLSLLYHAIINNGRKELFSIPVDYFYTFSFILMFITGALLAKYKDRIIPILTAYSWRLKMIILIVGILLYTIRYWLFAYFENGANATIADICITFGVAIFIMLSFSTRASVLLQNRIIHFFGKISYSIYLYHAIVLFSLIYLLYPRVPLYLLWVLAFFGTICIAYISYRYIEKPAIHLGKVIRKRY